MSWEHDYLYHMPEKIIILTTEMFVFTNILCAFHQDLVNWVTLFTDTAAAAAAAKSLQSCLTLCDPIDGSPPGPPILGILQERTLEWVAISFSNAWKWKVKGKLLSRVRLLATPWTAAHKAPPSMGFSRLEYWSGEPLPSRCTLCSGMLKENQ